MIVVLPLLSNPRHKTWTSFFFSPSHPASLSNNPMAVAGSHRDHLLFRESELLEKCYMQGSAGTKGGHGAEQPHTWQWWCEQDPTQTLSQGLALHMSTWRVSWLQPGGLDTKVDWLFIALSESHNTLDSLGRKGSEQPKQGHDAAPPGLPAKRAKPKGGSLSFPQIVSSTPFRQQNSISPLQHLLHNLLNPALNKALSADSIKTLICQYFANTDMYKLGTLCSPQIETD